MTATLVALISLNPGAVTFRVDGEGFLRLAGTTKVLHTRQATFRWRTNRLETADGLPLIPVVRAEQPGAIGVGLDGTVTNNGKPVGRIVLARFNPGAATKEGAYLLAPKGSTLGNPGEGLFGVIRTESTPTAPATSTPAEAKPTTPQPAPQPSRAGTGLAIQFRPFADITGDRVLLRDIAEIAGGTTKDSALAYLAIQSAPLPGYNVKIDVAYVKSKVFAAGVKPDAVVFAGPENVEVRRKGQIIDPAKVLKVASEAVSTQLGVNYPIRAATTEPLYTIPGTVEITADSATQIGTQFKVMFNITVDGITQPRRELVFAPDRSVVFLKPNERVRVLYKSGSISVELDGVVKSGGATGDSIQVVISKDQIVSGIVTKDGRVEVKGR